jgi:hypothetical protein
LVTTDLEPSAEDLVGRYAARWGIEQAFADACQIMGVGEARNRTRRAVERTVPFGLICFSVVTVWYALHGHAPEDVTGHRSRARWYTTKTEPSYDDMAVKLRRVIIAARFRGPCPEQATPQETRAVLAAWAAAAHDQQKLRNTRDPVQTLKVQTHVPIQDVVHRDHTGCHGCLLGAVSAQPRQPALTRPQRHPPTRAPPRRSEAKPL